VIPKTTPSSITIDGAEYELNLTEYNAVRDSYSSTALSLDDLISSEYYKNLSDELKADAINYVYDLRYDKAIHDVLGIYKGNAVIVSDAIGIENMATLYIATKGIISDTDKLGNVISGSKRSKVISAINSLNVPREQKLLMIYAKGYTIKDGDIRGLTADRAKTVLLNYILRSSKLSKVQKEELAKMCGFEVKNGKIVLKSSNNKS
jgi:hypothetical protein